MNYAGKKIFITGHTGFKGSWLCRAALLSGAEVKGYALPPEEGGLYTLAGAGQSVYADIRDAERLKKELCDFRPDIVLHLAAQPLVRESYKRPLYTYEVNVMGTANLLDAVRYCDSVGAVVNVTTDKVYKNLETDVAYAEDARLGGFDPYSNSKACSELVAQSYRSAFFADGSTRIGCARAGNVIGGGDFAKDRIIPDCIRAAKNNETIVVRNRGSVRPWQHVLEPLYGYMLFAERLYENSAPSFAYNFGPHGEDCVTVGELVDIFCGEWGNASWEYHPEAGAVHEAGLLKLDTALAERELGWKPKLHVRDAVGLTVEFAKRLFDGEDAGRIMDEQIKNFFEV